MILGSLWQFLDFQHSGQASIDLHVATSKKKMDPVWFGVHKKGWLISPYSTHRNGGSISLICFDQQERTKTLLFWHVWTCLNIFQWNGRRSPLHQASSSETVTTSRSPLSTCDCTTPRELLISAVMINTLSNDSLIIYLWYWNLWTASVSDCYRCGICVMIRHVVFYHWACENDVGRKISSWTVVHLYMRILSVAAVTLILLSALVQGGIFDACKRLP